MRRARAAVLVAAAVVAAAGPGAAHAGRPRPRKVVEAYTTFGVNILSVDLGEPGVSHVSVELEPLPGERKVSLELRDESGYRVRGRVSQDREPVGTFCGQTPKPLSIAPKKTVLVQVFSGACGSSWGLATEGTVTATFE